MKARAPYEQLLRELSARLCVWIVSVDGEKRNLRSFDELSSLQREAQFIYGIVEELYGTIASTIFDISGQVELLVFG